MWYDLAVAAILLFCMIRGAKKGFLWQLAGIAAVVLCFVFAETASLAIAPYLKIDPPLNRWVSMLLLYVACSFLCFAVARAMQNGLEKAKFEDYDRHLGGVVGLLKGGGIAVVVTFFAVTLSETLRPIVLASHSGHAAAVVMDKLSPVFPEELGKVLKPHLDEFHGFEEEFHGGQLADGSDDPGNLFGDDPFGEGSGEFGDFDGFGETSPGDPWVEPRGDSTQGPLAGGGSNPAGDGSGRDPFGWGVDPRTNADRLNGRPVSGDGSFGDSTRGDFGSAPGEGGDWFDDGGLNADRLRNEAGTVARDLWNDVPEETRRNLTDSLTESATNAARRRVEDGLGVRLDNFLSDPAQPGADPAATQPTRQELIAEIAAIYNRDENVQAMIRQQSARTLGPVPEDAAIDVLQDWLADLRGPAAGPDPDPVTTKATTLRERITRRLTARTARPGETAPRR
ncbi:CvpA family protein [Alienimonas californiensis]|uniref:Colicin V production protein n=1 Tax=Alienimonas californiensis TaxID=2527989 RepID=A0A517PES9_9PLAN|nr:CvpA family protein [Alienimonas californiensis]QDT17878.1 Colicin V production protein [Alienimonas californiensis]